MFNIVEKNQKLVKGIMIAVAATFVLWGIGGYLGNAGDDGYVAKVGSQKIYPRDIDQAIGQNPQNSDKMQVLFGLINRQLLISNIDAYHMIATKSELQQQIASIPAFQNSKGEFSLSMYQEFLRAKFMSAEQFQVNIGQQILINQFLDVFKNSYFTSELFNKQFAKLLSRERNVTSYTINLKDFYNKINLTDQQISDYYQQNIAKFTDPEKAKVQYLVLDPVMVAQTIQVSDKDLDNYIASHKANISGEQIDASHILFTVPANATPDAKAAIKAKAAKVLMMVQKNPGQFAALAHQYSEDPGSAANGGDLGTFGKGVMVKPFEDVAFNLKPGQVSKALVETQYGYHIIKLNSIKGNTPDEVRKLALSQLQKQQAVSKLQKDVDILNDISYNQPGSLEPAAKKLGLTVQTSKDWVIKGAISGDFANAKTQSAIFNQDVINKHNNSEVVDLGDGSYAVYHVTDYQASKVLPLAQVRDKIVDQMKSQTAASMASTEGQQQISQLQQGTLNLKFGNPEKITMLGQTDGIGPNAIKQIFGTSIAKLPAYTGSIDNNGNFVIYKISGEVIDPKLDEQNQKIVEQLGASDANMVFGAYMGSLRSKFSVSYKVDRLNLQSK